MLQLFYCKGTFAVIKRSNSMKNVLIVNQKGGVGKTTIADELAFALERSGYTVGFQNLDNQGGAVHASTMTTGEEDYVIIDTPGSLSKDFTKWCQAADVILMPTHASNLDLIPLLRCWDLAKDSKTQGKIAVIVNKYDERRRADQDFMKFLSNAEMPVWATLPQATAFVQANTYATSVYDLDSNSKATMAMQTLADKLIEETQND
jgi:chromosome partitioning protein